MNLDFFEKYKYKIKSKIELKKILKKLNQKKQLCAMGFLILYTLGMLDI